MVNQFLSSAAASPQFRKEILPPSHSEKGVHGSQREGGWRERRERGGGWRGKLVKSL